MSKEAERAELIQSLKAFLIPSSLFVATVIMSGGTFLIYSGYALGWAFIAVSLTVMVTAMVAFIKFQNKLRVQGVMPNQADEMVGQPEEGEPASPAATEPRELNKVS